MDLVDRHRRLEDLAATQRGLVTRGQLLELGFSPDAVEKMIRRGRLFQLHPRTYVLGGVPRTWERDLYAAQLWAGPESVISHRSAAALWQLDGVQRSVMELTTARALRSRQSLTVYRKRLRPGDVRQREGFRLTSIPRTLLDLAAVAPPASAERALHSAVHSRLVSLDQLKEQLDPSTRRGVRGARLFAELVAQVEDDPAVESILERKLARLLKRVSLPAIAQHEIRDGPRVVARVDFAFPGTMVAVECDGYRYHGARHQWKRDLERRTALGRLGWRVLHFTWEDVRNRPDWVVGEIKRTLRADPLERRN